MGMDTPGCGQPSGSLYELSVQPLAMGSHFLGCGQPACALWKLPGHLTGMGIDTSQPFGALCEPPGHPTGTGMDTSGCGQQLTRWTLSVTKTPTSHGPKHLGLLSTT